MQQSMRIASGSESFEGRNSKGFRFLNVMSQEAVLTLDSLLIVADLLGLASVIG